MANGKSDEAAYALKLAANELLHVVYSVDAVVNAAVTISADYRRYVRDSEIYAQNAGNRPHNEVMVHYATLRLLTDEALKARAMYDNALQELKDETMATVNRLHELEELFKP